MVDVLTPWDPRRLGVAFRPRTGPNAVSTAFGATGDEPMANRCRAPPSTPMSDREWHQPC